MPTAQPLRTGDPRTLGPYELSGRLGEGGQGVVFLGTLAGESYAVKLLRGPVSGAAFLREVELAKHVARFCTAQVMDAGFDEDRPYIVSEYVDGPSLAREVMLTGPRRGGALERLAVGTVTAIAAIHRAGIVHRDLKPQNVLLGPDGPRVIDFGLARALDAAATLTNRGVGTPAYMAPEQITASAITGAVDVFSWGGTMCFAANGRAPFGQDSVAPVLHRILTARPDLGSLDGPLRALVEACLDKDARNRPTSRELLLELLGTSGSVPAEVLRSPPPHILPAVPPPRVPAVDSDPAPLAEPEATGEAGAYHLLESYAPGREQDAEKVVPDQGVPPREACGVECGLAPRPGVVLVSGAEPGRLSPGVDGGESPGSSADGGPALRSSGGLSSDASGEASRLRGSAYRGSPAGYPVERVVRRDAPSGGGGTDRSGGSARSDAEARSARGGESAPPVPGAGSGGLGSGRGRGAGSEGSAPSLRGAGAGGSLPSVWEARPEGSALSSRGSGARSVRGGGSGGLEDLTGAGRRRKALGRAGSAVAGAVLVTGGVLVSLFVPLFREDGMQVRAGTPTSAPAVAPSSPEVEDTPKERPPTQARREDSRPPPSKQASVRKPAGNAVPEVVGLSRGAAVRALERAGLVAGGVTEVDSARKIGRVLASRPAAGTRVAAGAAVALDVSAGVRVPAVTGMRRGEAEKAVTGAGLKVGRVSTTCARKPDGEVLSSAPEAGARVSGGAAVSLVVARRGVPVPGVAGQSRDGALAAVRAAGFTPAIRTQVVEDESRWDVAVAQDPAPDTCSRPGRRVTVTVGAQPPGGPGPTEPTPSVTGEPSTEP